MRHSVGLIIGTGLDRMGLEVVARSPAKTPYGEPSSALLDIRLGEYRVPCIARHGEAHSIAPHAVNYRANAWALHQHGVRQCVALNAVGAIGADLAPGYLAIPNQLIDYSYGRAHTFHEGDAEVVHVDFTDPFDPVLRGRIADAAQACGLAPRSGVYGVTQGPRLETAAEIDRLEREGCTMVGMTAMPEAALARELGMAYAICAVAVNHAAGRGPGERSIHAQLERFLADGYQRAGALLRVLIPDLCRAESG